MTQKSELIYANTKSQRLDQHLFAVGYLAYRIIKRLVPQDNNLAEASFIAGCWHDIGKIDPAFQNWLNKKLKKKEFEEVPDDGQHIEKISWQNYPRHNEISLLLFHLLKSEKDSKLITRLKHVIYWHHAKPLRKKDNKIEKIIDIFNKLNNIEQNYLPTVGIILKSVKDIVNNYNNIPIDTDYLDNLDYNNIEESLEEQILPIYKRYSKKNLSVNIKKTSNTMQKITLLVQH